MNGIILRWHDLNGKEGDYSEVAPEHHEAQAIGSEIWSDIKNVMDCFRKNKVRLTIKYEPL